MPATPWDRPELNPRQQLHRSAKTAKYQYIGTHASFVPFPYPLCLKPWVCLQVGEQIRVVPPLKKTHPYEATIKYSATGKKLGSSSAFCEELRARLPPFPMDLRQPAILWEPQFRNSTRVCLFKGWTPKIVVSALGVPLKTTNKWIPFGFLVVSLKTRHKQSIPCSQTLGPSLASKYCPAKDQTPPRRAPCCP